MSAADKNVVVHVPDRRLARARSVKDVVWFAMVIEVALHSRRHDLENASIADVGNVKLAIRIFAS
jgi:hypothetical protein